MVYVSLHLRLLKFRKLRLSWCFDLSSLSKVIVPTYLWILQIFAVVIAFFSLWSSFSIYLCSKEEYVIWCTVVWLTCLGLLNFLRYEVLIVIVPTYAWILLSLLWIQETWSFSNASGNIIAYSWTSFSIYLLCKAEYVNFLFPFIDFIR